MASWFIQPNMQEHPEKIIEIQLYGSVLLRFQCQLPQSSLVFGVIEMVVELKKQSVFCQIVLVKE